MTDYRIDPLDEQDNRVTVTVARSEAPIQGAWLAFGFDIRTEQPDRVLHSRWRIERRLEELWREIGPEGLGRPPKPAGGEALEFIESELIDFLLWATNLSQFPSHNGWRLFQPAASHCGTGTSYQRASLP